MKHADATHSSPLADKLMEFSRADGVLAIRGLQAALIDAAIALDNAVTSTRSETAEPEGYPGIAHDLETMRTALVTIRDECFSGNAYDIAVQALASTRSATPIPEASTDIDGGAFKGSYDHDLSKAFRQPATPSATRLPSPHTLQPTETDTKFLGADTQVHYAGSYPPYWNLTMVRMKSDVVLTIRLPTSFGEPPGATSSVRFTNEMWRDFVKKIEAANQVFEVVDFLDAQL